MSRPIVYLAGPITGLSYGACTDWRAWAAATLADVGISGANPMRGNEYLKGMAWIGGTPHEAYMKNAMLTPKSIVARDRYDVRTADAVLMNLLGAKQVSIGTMIEAGWADAWRVPLIVAIEPYEQTQNVHNHAMLLEMASYVVPSLEDAVHMVTMLLAPRGSSAPTVEPTLPDEQLARMREVL